MSADVLRVVQALERMGPAGFAHLAQRCGMEEAELGQALAWLDARGLAERSPPQSRGYEGAAGTLPSAWRLAVPRPTWHGARP